MPDDWELSARWSAPDGPGANWSPNGPGDPQLNVPHPAHTLPMTYTAQESTSDTVFRDTSGLDGVKVTATYCLTFHDAVDGWHTNGPAYEIDPLLFPNAVADGEPQSQPAGATIHTAISKQLDYIDYGPGVRTLGGLLTSGAAVYPLLADATGPIGIGLTGLMISTGFSAGLFDPREPKWTKDVPTDLSDFEQDIADQVKINNGSAVAAPLGAPNYVLAPSVPRFSDPRWGDTLAPMSPTQQQQYWVGTGQGGKFYVTATDVLHQILAPYAAYQFDTAGLVVGSDGNPAFALGNIKRSGAIEAVRTWAWVPDGTPGTR